jgi:hypothetical protein
MRSIAATLIAVWLVTLATPVLSCACEIDCKPGETYSDDQEMCVPDATS